jgi:hypothetical protein
MTAVSGRAVRRVHYGLIERAEEDFSLDVVAIDIPIGIPVDLDTGSPGRFFRSAASATPTGLPSQLSARVGVH